MIGLILVRNAAKLSHLWNMRYHEIPMNLLKMFIQMSLVFNELQNDKEGQISTKKERKYIVMNSFFLSPMKELSKLQTDYCI